MNTATESFKSPFSLQIILKLQKFQVIIPNFKGRKFKLKTSHAERIKRWSPLPALLKTIILLHLNLPNELKTQLKQCIDCEACEPNFNDKLAMPKELNNYKIVSPPWQTQDYHFTPIKTCLRCSTCVLVFGCWELNHVIFLKLRKKELLAKLCKFAK